MTAFDGLLTGPLPVALLDPRPTRSCADVGSRPSLRDTRRITGTTLVATLEISSPATRNAAPGAGSTSTVRNTLKNRLAKIEEIIGLYPEDPDSLPQPGAGSCVSDGRRDVVGAGRAFLDVVDAVELQHVDIDPLGSGGGRFRPTWSARMGNSTVTPIHDTASRIARGRP